MVSKMLNMFQVGLMGQMGSGSEGIQKCFGITRNVTQHTHTRKGNESHHHSTSDKQIATLSHTASPSFALLGCSPQACKPCTCPAPRLKTESRVSDRDIDGLIDGRSYMSKARGSWSYTPPWMVDNRKDTAAAVFAGGSGVG